MKEANQFFGARLACLRNQKRTIYAIRTITDEPQKETNDSYKTLGIICPAEIPMQKGRIVYTPSESGSLPPEKKRRKKKQSPSTVDTEASPSKDPRRRGIPEN